MPKRAANELSDAEKHCINLVAQESTDQDATTLFFTDKEEFNRLLRAALGVPTAQEVNSVHAPEVQVASCKQL